MKKYESEICANCGADYGLHQYATNQCPRFGREESNPNKPKQWDETVFEDSGLTALHDAAPDLLEALEPFSELVGRSPLQLNEMMRKAKAAIAKAKGQ